MKLARKNNVSVLNIKDKLVFIYIPKTGSRSMEQGGLLGKRREDHGTLESLYERYGESVDIDTFYKIAFVRNPFDRFASIVLNHRLRKRDATPEDFSKWIADNRGGIDHWMITRPMYHFLQHKGRIFSKDEGFIGRVENIDEDWKVVCKRIGVTNKLPHLNKGKYRMDYRKIYNAESEKFVRDYYAEDFKAFNYELSL